MGDIDEEIEVREISDKEIWVKTNKFSIIHDNIIYVIAVGEQTTEFAKAQAEICMKMSGLIKGKVNFLIDLNKSGKNTPGARKTWKILTEHDNTEKVATFGLHPVAKVIASFVIRASSGNKMRFFSTKEEAIAWLKE
ncbi:STAS/SEC14 domain-containing protein [uncultured Sunxiuqinia sp.]|uniref:DUF7793 family protein n=1 Tax=uncultured Sunxiuqinia sp. TaxID=1573825 RepID=UPI002AA71E64|nr:STAS/SEC14 domain-containing protein [uncultured Sunxiuqinia sp.]